MVKRKKRVSKKRTVPKIIPLPTNELRVEKALIENFVSLQKVMTNLSGKFDNLANQISKLLDLFEISAKVLAEKDVDTEGNKRDNAKIIEKLESIMDQNKIIARGLTLMHDKIGSSQNYPAPEPEPNRNPFQRMPVKSLPRATIRQREDGEYHKSISSTSSPKI